MNILQTIDENILLGIRPEHIGLCDHQSESGYPVNVVDSDYHGADTLLTVALESQQLLKLSLKGHHHYTSGDTLMISWAASDECYFDGNDKKRCIPTVRIPLSVNQSTLGEKYA